MENGFQTQEEQEQFCLAVQGREIVELAALKGFHREDDFTSEKPRRIFTV